MKKTKKSILASIAIFAMLAMAMPVFAASGGQDLPGENEPFWTIFAEMNTPTDTNCVAHATSYVNSQNFPDSQKQGEIAGYTQMCTEIANMPSEMQSNMAVEGVTSNLFVAPNWHTVSGLYFEKTGMGKIEFTNTIDFMTYRFMNFINNFGDIVQFNDGYISLNSAMMADMKYYGARLTMLGLDFPTTPDIYVTDANGATMHKATSSDISGATYDPATGTLTFNTSHFSAFKAVTKGSKVKKLKMTKVTPNKIKYSPKKRTFKITIKGTGMYKKGANTSCKMGSEDAQKVKVSRNGKNAVCTFSMSSFSTLGLYSISFTVDGTGQISKTNAVRVR
jgi:hypothetical protein